jgi:hypothetical protein
MDALLPRMGSQAIAPHRAQHFAAFTPILAFIHVLSDLFVAAKAVDTEARDAWDQPRLDARRLVGRSRAGMGRIACVAGSMGRAFGGGFGRRPTKDPRQEHHLSSPEIAGAIGARTSPLQLKKEPT